MFSKNRPLIYKLEEGKYIIDLASSLGTGDTKKTGETKDKIKPSTILGDIEEETKEEEETSNDEQDNEQVSESSSSPEEDTNKIKELE